MNVQQSSNVDVNWAGRKYNIAPEFLTSPYLSKPIGFIDPEKHRQKSKESSQQSIKSTRRRTRTENDAESVISFRTQRSSTSQRSQQSYRSSRRSSVTTHMTTKNILLPREIDKLCREFRQKHNLLLKTQIKEQVDDDNSTICSEFAASLDDKAVYLHCHRDHDVENALFPGGPLFAEMTYRSATKEKAKGPIIKLPPVRLIHHDKTSGDVSDLDSLHSGPDQGRRRRR